MKDGARLQAVIEMIDGYDPDLGPLDEYVQSYLRHRRFIGSHDRRTISHDLFNIYRAYPSLQHVITHVGLNEVRGRSLVLSYLHWYENKPLSEIQNLFTGQTYHPEALSESETKCLSTAFELMPPSFPDWLFEKLLAVFKDESENQFAALNQQAAVDLCINTKMKSREAVLKDLHQNGIQGEKTNYSPLGIRLQKRIHLSSLDVFKKGIIDIQDEGTQLISLLCDLKPGMQVCDYCAGAGGKTRTLSILLENQGTIIATDSDKDRLGKLQKRLMRGHYSNITVQTVPEVHEHYSNGFDRLLLDVPCSGTGRLRRQPELKMSLSLEKLNHLILLQQQILNDAAHLVKTKGYLIYATCSLLQEENEMQIDWFLKNHPDFKLVPAESILSKILGRTVEGCQSYLRLTPYTHGTDGFFAAVLEKQSSGVQVEK